MSNDRILIVDKALYFRKITANFIQAAGYTVIGETDNGDDALNKYQRLHPDLLITDLVLSKSHGFNLIKNIINMDDQAKILVCSTICAHPTIYRAIKLGAKGYLSKPFSKETLLYETKRILQIGRI